MFNQYPYLNLNDLNLDYLLNEIKSMYNDVTNFVSINAIKYADPIQWNITSQYEKNTVVIDPLTGTAYISVAPVPSGVALTRTEYWTVVFDLGSFVTRAAQNFTSHWESDTTTTATFSTSTGGWLVWGDVLYKALTNITAGDTYVIGSNIEHFTIEDLYNAYLNTIAQILAIIGNLDDLTTWDKTSIVRAINSVKNDVDVVSNKVGNLNDLTTSDKSTVVNAINSVKNDIDTLSNTVGDLDDLTTTDKSSVVNSINSVKTDVDTARSLIDRSSIYNFFHNKNVLIIGDSNSIEGVAWRGHVWVEDFRDILNGTGATIVNNSESGRRITKPSGNTNNLVDVVDSLSGGNYDYIIVFLGINDWNEQSPLGDSNHYTNWDYTLFSDAIRYSTEKLKTLYQKAGLFFVTPLICNYATPSIPLVCYHNAIYANSIWHDRDVVVIDGFCAPNYWVNGTNATTYSIDGLHFNADYGPILARYIISSMMTGGSPKADMSYMQNLTVNSNIANGGAFLNYKSDGSVDFYLDVKLTTPAYEALITGGIPDFACNDYGGIICWGSLTDASNSVTSIEAVDFLNNSPYPKSGFYETNDRYYMRLTFKPASMNRNSY